MIFKKRNKHKHQVHAPSKDQWNDPWFYKNEDNGLYKIAIILDGEVQEIMTTETRLAALLLSSPIFIDVTQNQNHIHIGDKYNEEAGEILNDKEKEV